MSTANATTTCPTHFVSPYTCHCEAADRTLPRQYGEYALRVSEILNSSVIPAIGQLGGDLRVTVMDAGGLTRVYDLFARLAKSLEEREVILVQLNLIDPRYRFFAHLLQNFNSQTTEWTPEYKVRFFDAKSLPGIDSIPPGPERACTHALLALHRRLFDVLPGETDTRIEFKLAVFASPTDYRNACDRMPELKFDLLLARPTTHHFEIQHVARTTNRGGSANLLIG